MDAVEIGYPAEGLCRLPGVDVFVVPNNTYFVGIPGMGGDVMVIITPKMPVFEKNTFHRRVMKQFLTTLANLGQVFFMHHLVTLNIEQPIPFTGGFGNIGLVGMFHTTGIPIEVPGSMDNTDLVRADALYFC